jgi:hypothetical protein
MTVVMKVVIHLRFRLIHLDTPPSLSFLSPLLLCCPEHLDPHPSNITLPEIRELLIDTP